MDVGIIFEQMLVIFLMLVVGYVCYKIDILDDVAVKKLSRLLINVTMPAMIMAASFVQDSSLSGADVIRIFGVSASMYIFLGIAAFFVPKLLRLPVKEAGIYRFMIIFGNTGFMGYAIVKSIFGDVGVFAAAIMNLPFNVLSYSLGVYFINAGEKKGSFNFRLLINPGIISSVLSIAFYLLKISLPSVIQSTISSIGQISTPASMLVIGAILATIPLKSVFLEFKLYILTALKLLALPTLYFFVMRLFNIEQSFLGIATILCAMPSATNLTLLCAEYGGDVELASKGVFLTTLFSVATIPLLMWFLFAR